MKNKLLKRKILRYYTLFIFIVLIAGFLIEGSFALQDDMRSIGYGCIILSVFMFLAANSFLIIDEVKDLIAKKVHEDKE